MDYTTGFADEYLRQYASCQVRMMVLAMRDGDDRRANDLFIHLRQVVTETFREDVYVDNNPALTEWRLDQLNDWLQCEVVSQLGAVPSSRAFVLPELSADWSTVPVSITSSGIRSVSPLWGKKPGTR